MTHPRDSQLAQELVTLRAQILDRRRRLRGPRGSCACDDTGLCALHAEVANRLQDAEHHLELAVAALLNAE